MLVVDDEMLICLDIQMQLDQQGHRTLVASTYEGAVRALAAAPIDFAVLDWDLAANSAELLVSDFRQRQIPFLLCTGSTREEMEQLFPNIPLLIKPFMSDQLLAAVDRVAMGDVT